MPTDPRSHALAAACDEVFPLDAPTLVGLDLFPGRPRLVDPGGFVDPEDLVGFVAPDHWDGLAVVVSGRCHRLDAPHRRPAAARITYALDRRGSWASTITTLEGTTRAAGDGDGSPSGHLADCCHRVLGLPAAPEESSPRVLADVLWLIDVLDARAELGESFPIEDWEAIAALHVSTSCDTGELTWSDLHDEIVQRREGWDRFDETEVAWMDPSTFARFALGAHPPIGALLTRLEQLAPRSVMRKVHLLVTSVHQHAGIVRGDPPGGV